MDERRMLTIMREAAFAIRGLPPSPPAIPYGVPVMMPVQDGAQLLWRGTAGAEGYDVERAEATSGPWLALAAGVPDDATDRKLFCDGSAEAGASYYYRVRGRNVAGVTPFSSALQVVAPAVNSCGARQTAPSEP